MWIKYHHRTKKRKGKGGEEGRTVFSKKRLSKSHAKLVVAVQVMVERLALFQCHVAAQKEEAKKERKEGKQGGRVSKSRPARSQEEKREGGTWC